MLLAIIVGALFGFYFGCCTSNNASAPVHTYSFHFTLAVLFGCFTMVGGAPPLFALSFGGSIFIAAIVGVLLPESFACKAFLRR
jgi:hypothetical protein